ncbi:MAG: hypothetical protein HQK87_09070 [Nitrospinae bacterium]|nr:hypothetical protein [Nitrospinota bacterium]
MTRLLYWRVGGLGDTLLNLIPARWLAESVGPTTLAVDRRWREAVACFGAATVDEAPLSEALFRDDRVRLAEALAPFETIVAVRSDPDGALLAALRDATPQAKVVVIPPLPPVGAVIPYPVWLMERIGEALGLAPPIEPPLPTPVTPWRGETRELLLTPGSGGRTKRLSPQTVAAVAAWGSAQGLAVTALLGPTEQECGIELPPLPALLSPPFPTLAKRMAGAAMVVGADSGPTHLAALLGAPTLALFGPSDPHRERKNVIEYPRQLFRFPFRGHSAGSGRRNGRESGAYVGIREHCEPDFDTPETTQIVFPHPATVWRPFGPRARWLASPSTTALELALHECGQT